MIDITSRIPDCKIRAYSTGEIVISAPLARKMDVSDGDHVQIFMSRSMGFMELYISKCHGACGLKTKRRMKRDHSLRVFSKKAAGIMLNGQQKGIFRIGEVVQKEGRELFTIIYCKNYAERKEVHTIQGDHQTAVGS